MKTRLFIIIAGAIIAGGTIHYFQEYHETRRNVRWGNGFDNFSPRGSGPSRPSRGGRGRPGGMRTLEISGVFDQNKDGKLDNNERARARNHVQQERANGGGFPRRPAAQANAPSRGPRVSPDDVTPLDDQPLYDADTLRTLFIDFESEDWESELADFWKTDVDVPARLTVDGHEYEAIGVRFRGTSSFFTVGSGLKRSLNLAIDYDESKQRLYGYKTLNLLNAHTDPSFLRTILFNHIAGHYLPTPKANYVKLVINRESWGIYVNSQQFNKDFLDDWFGTRKGTRWKMLPNPRGGNGMAYEGDSPAEYQGRYLMKSQGGDADWAQLIAVFKVLNETSSEDMESALSPIFNIDRALWFLALENVFIDNDGYWTRASDFSMYTDRDERVHMVPHDSNETFRMAGGPGYQGEAGVKLDPLYGINDERKPLIFRLLNVPHLQARYLAHVRTIRDEWLDWERIAPLVAQYQNLIDQEIKQDTRKHQDYDAFQRSVTEDLMGSGFRGPEKRISLKGFIEQRRAYLNEYAPLKKSAPRIHTVTHAGPNNAAIQPQAPVTIAAAVDSSTDAVHLYYAEKKHAPFRRVPMTRADEETFEAEIPPHESGEKVFYYVEAQDHEAKTSTFYPRSPEFHALAFRVTPPVATDSPIVINELMASNTQTIADADGAFDDWIELHNRTNKAIDLEGYYLSDNPRNPRKWSFPKNTTLPAHGHLLVWADEDGQSSSNGRHTNFKLSKKGETISLYDRDERSNQRLDQVQFKNLGDDQSWGRSSPNDSNLEIVPPSPGKPNP